MDIPTANGRVYPRHVVEQAIRDVNWTIPVVMSADAGKTKVDLSNTVGLVTDLVTDGEVLKGNFKIYDTPMGMLAKKIIDVEPNFSIRPFGVAHVTQSSVRNINVVGNGYKLIGASISFDYHERDGEIQ